MIERLIIMIKKAHMARIYILTMHIVLFEITQSVLFIIDKYYGHQRYEQHSSKSYEIDSQAQTSLLRNRKYRFRILYHTVSRPRNGTDRRSRGQTYIRSQHLLQQIIYIMHLFRLPSKIKMR